jgi:hypothetical protein
MSSLNQVIQYVHCKSTLIQMEQQSLQVAASPYSELLPGSASRRNFKTLKYQASNLPAIHALLSMARDAMFEGNVAHKLSDESRGNR